MTVWLEEPSVETPKATVVNASGAHPAPVWGQTRLFKSASQAPNRKVESDPKSPEASAQPLPPDPHYYAARDLDRHPWPLAPLQLEHLAGARSGEVRLELLIDELGIVREVVFTERAHRSPVDENLRASLAATQFIPGRKDGHAVRCRIVLSVSYDVGSR